MDFDHDMKVVFARDGKSKSLTQNGNRINVTRETLGERKTQATLP